MIQFALNYITSQTIGFNLTGKMPLTKHFSFKFLTNFFKSKSFCLSKRTHQVEYPVAEVEMTKPLISLKILLLKVHIYVTKGYLLYIRTFARH